MTRDEVLQILQNGLQYGYVPHFLEMDDIFQDVIVHFLSVDQNILDNLLTYDDVRKYSVSVSKNIIARARRAYHRDAIIPNEAESVFPTTVSLTEPFKEKSELYAEMRELRERVMQYVLSQIPLRHRQILEYVASNLSVAQYAREQLMEYNAARQLHHRAKKSLQAALEKLQIPPSLWRLGESDKMSPDLCQWLLEGPYSADILCTEIASDASPSTLSTFHDEDPFASLVVLGESTDHYADEIDISSMVLQSEEQYEDDLF